MCGKGQKHLLFHFHQHGGTHFAPDLKYQCEKERDKNKQHIMQLFINFEGGRKSGHLRISIA